MDKDSVLVLHTETGVRCGSFPNTSAAQTWIDNLGVTREYKERCYKIVNAIEYWRDWDKTPHCMCGSPFGPGHTCK